VNGQNCLGIGLNPGDLMVPVCQMGTGVAIGGKGGKSGKWEMGNGSGDKGMTIVVVELMTASV